jgi:hypothetical protein
MSIGKRVEEGVKRMLERDWEGALIPVSIAVGATARREFPNDKDNVAYKKFIDQNQEVIMLVATDGAWQFRQGSTVSLNCKIEGQQCSTISDVLYKVVRCSLVHEAELPASMKLTEGRPLQIVMSGSFISAPSKLVIGLIVAVVASPANRDEPFHKDCTFGWYGQRIGFNEFRGRKDKLNEVLVNGLWIRHHFLNARTKPA